MGVAKSVSGRYNASMPTFVLNEQKGLEMRVLLAASVCLLAVGSRAEAADPPDESSSTAKPTEEVVGREAFERLRRDRDNLLIQAKRLLQRNRELTGIKHKLDRSEENQRALLDEKEGMTQELVVLNEEIEEEKKRSGQVEGEVAELKRLQREMTKDRQRLEKFLAEARSESGVKKLEELINSLKKEKESLNSRLGDIRSSLTQLENGLKKERIEFDKRLEKNRIISGKEIAEYRNRLEGLQEKYAAEVKEKKALGREMAYLPKKLARETRKSGKILKGAANRHYNTGVFYAKRGEYKRALAEFQETLKVQPDHAFALYNLGNLYATHMVDRNKSIYYFGEYLRVSPDAKDKDLVRKYILTWRPREQHQTSRSRWSALGNIFKK